MASILTRALSGYRVTTACRVATAARNATRCLNSTPVTREAEMPFVTIFDTTLRDGEQTPGVHLNMDEKLIIASKLSQLGVDVCEAGFPIASDGDFAAVHAIASKVGNELGGRVSGEPMKICGLARAMQADIDRCMQAIEPALRHRIHVFLATSDIHLKHKLNITRAQCLTQIADMVRYANTLCDDIEFSPEDAGRTENAFLVEAYAVAIEAGATTLNMPDTVGYNTPEMYAEMVKYLIEHVPGSDKVIWSTHCHNDLGLATANTLAGITAGARQVEVTINGIGERAGNTSLEEVVMAMNVHKLGRTNITTEHISETSKLVSHYTGVVVQPNKAIVGKNAFAHESGIHQDGVLKHQETYEIMKPETVGIKNHDNLVMGKLSGRNGFASRATQLGYKHLQDDQIKSAFKTFKTLCDNKKVVSDGDIHAIFRGMLQRPGIEDWKLLELVLSTNSSGLAHSTATVTLRSPLGVPSTMAVSGATSVKAIFTAIDKLVQSGCVLRDYSIQSVTPGKDSLGTVVCRIGKKSEAHTATFNGESSHSDVLVASAEAYIAAINMMHHMDAMQESFENPSDGAGV
eukprot:m.156662 g.156662  ORF g.156662 m.156662 type:complete len:575 (-) comp31013_c0_seq1:57-1781(-)